METAVLQRPGAIVAGKYRLEKPLARGGVGNVWTARHVQLQQLVAVKFLDATVASSPQVRTRFEREARATANLKSPHVVQVFDYGVQGDTPYLVMELLRGETLHARLRRDIRLGMVETYAILAQIGKGLRRAHEEGFVHRDLKPANIYMAKGDDEDTVVKILDFGIAKETSGELIGESTRTGELVGSPHYMSPEQIRGEREVDARSDLWALGVIVYRALTGYLPFPGDVLTAVITKIVVDPIPSAGQYLPGAPASLETFFETALARDKSRRFQTVGALVRAFGEVAAEASGMSSAQLFGPGSGPGRGSLPSFPEFGTPNGLASSIPGTPFVPLGQLPPAMSPPRAVPGGATLQAATSPPQASQSGASMSAPVPPPRPPQAGASVSVSSPPAKPPQAGAAVSVSSPPAKPPQAGAAVSVSRPPARPPQAGASVPVAGPPPAPPPAPPPVAASMSRPPARPPQAGAAPVPSTPPPSGGAPTVVSAGVTPPPATPAQPPSALPEEPISLQGEPISLPGDSISLQGEPISLEGDAISLEGDAVAPKNEPRSMPVESVTVLGKPLFEPGALLSLPDEPLTVPRIPTAASSSPPVEIIGAPVAAIPTSSSPASQGPASHVSLSVSSPTSTAGARPTPRKSLWIFAVGGAALVLLLVAFGAFRSHPSASSGAPSGPPRAASPPASTPEPTAAPPPTEAASPTPAPSESSTTTASPATDASGRPAAPALSGKMPTSPGGRPRPPTKKPIDTID